MVYKRSGLTAFTCATLRLAAVCRPPADQTEASRQLKISGTRLQIVPEVSRVPQRSSECSQEVHIQRAARNLQSAAIGLRAQRSPEFCQRSPKCAAADLFNFWSSKMEFSDFVQKSPK